jgi:predicted PurR-regulated permease PerM
MVQVPSDIARTTFAVLFIGGLGVASFWVLRPFLAATVWAATLVVATWPLMLRVQHRLWDRRWLAVIVMILALLFVVVVPFWLAISTVVANAGRLGAFAGSLAAFRMPPTPNWVHTIPIIGASVAQAWADVANMGVSELAKDMSPYAGQAVRLFVSTIGDLGRAFVQFLLTIVVASVLYIHGEDAADFVRRFGHRLAGDRGVESVGLAAHAIRGVALGVVVSALIEAALGGAALAVAGLPFAALLTALIFIACILQIGPGVILIPAVIWSYWKGNPAWATFLLAASIVVIVLDNLLRPVLMRRGAQMSLLLVLAGVLGGISGFGLVGIFLGPTILAVAHTLLVSWMAADQSVGVPGACSSAPHAANVASQSREQ